MVIVYYNLLGQEFEKECPAMLEALEYAVYNDIRVFELSQNGAPRMNGWELLQNFRVMFAPVE